MPINASPSALVHDKSDDSYVSEHGGRRGESEVKIEGAHAE